MNISKSIQVCLEDTDMKKKKIAKELDVSQQTVTELCKSKTCSSRMLIGLSKVFGMSVSEFVSLGENDIETT